MKKKIFSLISIFIICFSLSFSFFDKVSFAADSVTYVVETSDGDHMRFEGQPGFIPFIVKSYISGDTAISESNRYKVSFIISNGYNIINNVSGWKPSNLNINDVRCQGYTIVGKNFNFIVSPSVPFIENKFNTYKEHDDYVASLIQDPTLIPINVTTYDTSLGSLQLQDSTSWRFLRYEPLNDNNIAPKNGYAYKVKLRTIFQDTTSTGQKYDKIQIMVRIKNIRSQWTVIPQYPWANKLQAGEYFSYYLSDLESPTTVDLQMIDYSKDENGKLNKVLYPIFQPAFDKLDLKKPVFSNDYWFICDYTICYRPVTVDGNFGDWFYITPDKSLSGDNMVGGGQSINAVTGTAQSDDDPNSMAFNPLPEDSFSSRTASGNGDTLGDAISNSNDSLIGGSITSGGSLTSNITDLFSLFTNMPSIISTIFSWLPPWVLSLFAIGFALFVPIFIYKFVRG